MSTAEKIYEHVKTLPEPAVQEVLDFVEFVEAKLGRSGTEALRVRTERLRAMRAAKGIWQNRDDLPDLAALRGEWDRV